MAITDTGVPSTDPHTLIKNLIESNMVSPDGIWTPLVNTGWLEFKRQKTFQISIMPSYGMSFPVHLTEGATLNTDATQFMLVTLYADTRAKHWQLYRKFIDLMHTRSLTTPDLTGSTGVNGTDYHFIKIMRSEETKAVEIESPKKGMGGDKEGDCIGYQSQHTLAIRWQE